jgi:tetratricopeptide (TPR) repeat protein
MFKRILLLAAAIPLLSIQVMAQEIAAPKLTPSPSSEKQDLLVREGIALHDRGDYQGAIRKFQEVLSENPDHAMALYELGFSYFSNKDYKLSLEIAFKGAQYKSEYLSGFYVLIGNNLDHAGDREKAIKVYKSAIKLFPGDAQLHYNLAVTYISANKFDDAKQSLKSAVASDPNHRSGHLGLSQLYHKDNYKIPALLAMCRFLVLEPTSQRSGPALQRVGELMAGGASKGADEKNITITLDPSAKTDEGDFNAISMAVSLLSAARHLDKNKNKTEIQMIADDFDTLFSVLSEAKSDKKQSGFAWNYYRPYFVEMKSRKHVEAFCYYICQAGKSDEVQRWLAQNYEKVKAFLDWSKTYQWTKIS